MAAVPNGATSAVNARKVRFDCTVFRALGTATWRMIAAWPRDGTRAANAGRNGEPSARSARRSSAADAKLYPTTAPAAPARPRPGGGPTPKMSRGETASVTRPPTAPTAAGYAVFPAPRRQLDAAWNTQ